MLDELEVSKLEGIC